jgi:pimeloyl-ACP methyl ester carboxylesterase
MRRDPSLAWPAPFFMIIPLFLTACSTHSGIPQWFDAIHRMPVRTALVDGYRLAYLDEGIGPPVILIHGFGGALWQWEHQQGSLAAGHRIVTLDLLGSGFSDKPDIAYTPARLVESFRGFMDALNIPRASLVGNSMGAGVVIGMALTYPERVSRMVLIGGFPDHVREKLTSPLMQRAIDTWAPAWLIKFGNRFTGLGVTRTVLTEMVHDPGLLTPTVVERSYRNRKRSGMIGPLLDLLTHLPEWEAGFATRLGEIRQPAMIVWGARDKVFPPQVGRDLASTVPNAMLELIPEAGHIPMWERPDLVNPLLMKFLAP